MKRELTAAKAWLREMCETIADFDPDTNFLEYHQEGRPRFDEATAEILNNRRLEVIELFDYHYTAPGDDIFSFCLNYQNNCK